MRWVLLGPGKFSQEGYSCELWAPNNPSNLEMGTPLWQRGSKQEINNIFYTAQHVACVVVLFFLPSAILGCEALHFPKRFSLPSKLLQICNILFNSLLKWLSLSLKHQEAANKRHDYWGWKCHSWFIICRVGHWYPEMACYVCQLRGPLNSSEEFPIKKQNVDLKFHASVESLPASL